MHHSIKYSFLMLIAGVALLGSGCSQEEDSATVLSAVETGVISPSTSSVRAANSVSFTETEISELSDEELIESVITHLQSILAKAEAVDPAEIPENKATRLSKRIEHLKTRITQLQSDSAVQAAVVERIRSGQFPPFHGGYEGQGPRRKKGKPKFESVEEMCAFLSKRLENAPSESGPFYQRISSKYEQECK